jgi:hypothetical protein
MGFVEMSRKILQIVVRRGESGLGVSTPNSSNDLQILHYRMLEMMPVLLREKTTDRPPATLTSGTFLRSLNKGSPSILQRN